MAKEIFRAPSTESGRELFVERHEDRTVGITIRGEADEDDLDLIISAEDAAMFAAALIREE